MVVPAQATEPDGHMMVPSSVDFWSLRWWTDMKLVGDTDARGIWIHRKLSIVEECFSESGMLESMYNAIISHQPH